MRETTLCYIEKDGKYLMLYRNKKKNDASEGKWIGIGGKLEPGETADECILREVLEETGLTLTDLCKRGKVYFYSDMWEDEIMYLYTASRFHGKLTKDCNEGELKWIPVNEVMNLNLWEGDRIFLRQLADGVNDICLSVRYEGDTLAEWKDMRIQSI